MAMLGHFYTLLQERRIYLIVCGIEKELEAHEAQFPPEQAKAALLLSLHSVQDREGWVPEKAIDSR